MTTQTPQVLYCGRQEEPTILISRLLLRMRRMYVASIRLDFHQEWMECTERNLITPVLNICHCETYTKHSVRAKAFWPSIVCRPHSLTFGCYYLYMPWIYEMVGRRLACDMGDGVSFWRHSLVWALFRLGQLPLVLPSTAPRWIINHYGVTTIIKLRIYLFQRNLKALKTWIIYRFMPYHTKFWQACRDICLAMIDF